MPLGHTNPEPAPGYAPGAAGAAYLGDPAGPGGPGGCGCGPPPVRWFRRKITASLQPVTSNGVTMQAPVAILPGPPEGEQYVVEICTLHLSDPGNTSQLSLLAGTDLDESDAFYADFTPDYSILNMFVGTVQGTLRLGAGDQLAAMWITSAAASAQRMWVQVRVEPA